MFDEAYYTQRYPEVAESGMAPIEHYLSIGWREGKNPSHEFDSAFYLSANPDVLAANMNPLLHFVKYGKAEGRSWRSNEFPSLLTTAPTDIKPARPYSDAELKCVRPFFDSAYYLSMYPDVREAGIDPFEHFMSVGWREYRNPCANFNTATYLRINKDVATSDLNPLLHYAQNGMNEDRIIKLDCLEELKVLDQKFYWQKSQDLSPTVMLESVDKLSSFLSTNEDRPLIVAVSHDNYLSNVGGIQIFIAEEESRFRATGHVYMHLSPIFAPEGVNTYRDCVQVVLNGEPIGVFSLADLAEYLGRKIQQSSFYLTLIIHSLINADEFYYLDTLLKISWKRKYYWVHDYSLMCSEFNLLRNGIHPCGFPPENSASCFTCTGFQSRPQKKEILRRLVRNHFVFIAPSEAARSVAASAPFLDKTRIQVVRHITLVKRRKLSRKVIPKKARLRIAFCGHPSFHKGWGIFQKIVERSIHLDRYEFYHFGVNNSAINGITFVPVQNDSESRDKMVEAIEEHSIHVVVIPAIWKETFCYVAYEAILGGSLVFTTSCSGNVAAISKEIPQVKVFESEFELVNSFSSGRAATEISSYFAKGVPVFKAKYTGTTAALEVSSGS